MYTGVTLWSKRKQSQRKTTTLRLGICSSRLSSFWLCIHACILTLHKKTTLRITGRWGGPLGALSQLQGGGGNVRPGMRFARSDYWAESCLWKCGFWRGETRGGFTRGRKIVGPPMNFARSGFEGLTTLFTTLKPPWPTMVPRL